MTSDTSHLQPDGTVFPPVTPDPPLPPGYEPPPDLDPMVPHPEEGEPESAAAAPTGARQQEPPD